MLHFNCIILFRISPKTLHYAHTFLHYAQNCFDYAHSLCITEQYLFVRNTISVEDNVFLLVIFGA